MVGKVLTWLLWETHPPWRMEALICPLTSQMETVYGIFLIPALERNSIPIM